MAPGLLDLSAELLRQVLGLAGHGPAFLACKRFHELEGGLDWRQNCTHWALDLTKFGAVVGDNAADLLLAQLVSEAEHRSRITSLSIAANSEVMGNRHALEASVKQPTLLVLDAAPAGLQHLSLQFPSFVEWGVPLAAALASFTALRSLELAGDGGGYDWPALEQALQASPVLEGLALRMAPLPWAAARSAAHLSTLRRFAFAGAPGGRGTRVDPALVPLLAALPALEEVELGVDLTLGLGEQPHRQQVARAGALLKKLARLPVDVRLRLSIRGSVPPAGLAALGGLRELDLDLGPCAMAPVPEDLWRCAGLTRLALASADLRELPAELSLPRLAALALRQCCVAAAPVGSAPALPPALDALPALRARELERCFCLPSAAAAASPRPAS